MTMIIFQKKSGEEKMVNIELLSYKINELKMRNDLKINRGVHLINRNDFWMEFIDNSRAAAVLTELVRMQEGDEFYLELAIEGLFHLEDVGNADSWKKVHVRCYDKLFPYAKQIMEMLAANSGLSGFVLRKKHIKEGDVHVRLEKERKYSSKIIELPMFLK